jgi:hypothetical protein
MNVVSYYQPIENLKFSNESCELLKKWESNWKSMGWNPIILNEDYAKKNIYYKKINLDDYNSVLYSGINNSNYLKQCYMRWLAYTQFVFENGSTIWCDYDVYNKTFTLEKFKSLNNTEQLFCGSGSVGLMKLDKANQILDIFEKVYLSSSLEDLKSVSDFHKNHFIKYKDTFSDMHIIQGTFFNSVSGLNRICFNFMINDIKKQIKDFDLFHIHGGVFDKTNENGLFYECLNSKTISRHQQWELIENLINSVSSNETFLDLILRFKTLYNS